MFTPLSKVRAESTTVVVGTLSTTPRGPVVDVEYNLRGRAGKGALLVRESPDGRVFVPVGKTAKNRVVAFIDAQNRLRWIGRLLAGPSLEKGVLELRGFFDFNAHLVGPGVMTLMQLMEFLAHGTMHQRFRATLSFPDGRGGLRRSGRQVIVDYAPLTRKVSGLRGLRAACLDHPSLMPPNWGKFRLHLYCRGSLRRLVLTGRVSGINPRGDILVDAVPTEPVLNAGELDRYLRNPGFTKVARTIRVTTASGTTWTWHWGRGLVDAGGRMHRLRGMSVSSQSRAGKIIHIDSYRFDGIVLAVPSKTNQLAAHLTLIQRANARQGCTVTHGGKRERCTLRPGTAVWRR